jgi:short-subunit dehydrogenase
LKEALEGNLLDKNKVNFFKVNAEDENAVSTVFSSGIKEKIDVLVCALGVYSTLPSTKDFNQFKTDFDNNVFSNLIPVKVALNQEIFNDNARIVVMSSTVANFAPFELCSYASSKWCLENICFSLRAELESKNIKIDIVHPWTIKNKHSKVFNFSFGVEPLMVAKVIEKIIKQARKNNHLPGKNYSIPYKYNVAHFVQRAFPGIINAGHGLMPMNQRKKYYRKLELKSGLITGAASGSGKELAVLYCKQLSNLYILDKDQQGLETVKKTIESISNCTVSIICLDLNKLDEVTLFMDTIPPVDLLVNCSGARITGSVYRTDIDVWRRILNINFYSSVLIISRLLNKPNLPKKIINVLSASAIAGQKSTGLYSSTSAAFWSFTRSLRRAYGNQIQVMEVLPLPYSSNIMLNHTQADSNYSPGSSIKTEVSKAAGIAKSIFVNEKRCKEIVFIPFTARLLCILEAVSPFVYKTLCKVFDSGAKS